jgi:hypothetical protein
LKILSTCPTNLLDICFVLGEGISGRWEAPEDGYDEQIVLTEEKRELAAEEGSSRDTGNAKGLGENSNPDLRELK